MDNKKVVNKEPIYLCSYPRSGNTWTRLLLSDIFMQNNNLETTSKNVLEASDEIIPDEHIHNTSKASYYPIHIIKSHYKKTNRFKKVIFLFRQPADSLVSYFHYLYGIKKLPEKFNEDIDIFVQNEVYNWISYTKSFFKDINTSNTIFISYEQLHENPTQVLKKISKFINYDFSNQQIQKALNNHSFNNHKGTWQMEEKDGKGGAFFRKGKVNSSLEELKETTLNEISEKTKDIYKKLKDLELSKNYVL